MSRLPTANPYEPVVGNSSNQNRRPMPVRDSATCSGHRGARRRRDRGDLRRPGESRRCASTNVVRRERSSLSSRRRSVVTEDLGCSDPAIASSAAVAEVASDRERPVYIAPRSSDTGIGNRPWLSPMDRAALLTMSPGSPCGRRTWNSGPQRRPEGLLIMLSPFAAVTVEGNLRRVAE